MENLRRIRVKKLDYDCFQVIADSSTYGKNAIMFEGESFDECLDYIQRKTGSDEFTVIGNIARSNERTGKHTFVHFS